MRTRITSYLFAAALVIIAMGKSSAAEDIYIIPHFHWDLAYKQPEADYLKYGVTLIDAYLKMAGTDPDFKFVLDQVPLIENYIKKRPGSVEQMKRLIKEGRLEISGAMYVQPDVNLPDGESLIRQIFYGQRWLEKNLGTRARYLWNIDSFGHLYQMPQIAAGAGLEAYVWSAERTDINKPAWHAFMWRSPDGSAVLSQMLYPSYYAGANLGRSYPYDREHEWQLVETLLAALRGLEPRDRYIVMGGSDFMFPPPSLTQLAKDWNASHEDVKLIVALPSEFFKASAAETQSAPVVENTDYQVSWNGFFSNIIGDKLANREHENLLRQIEAVRTLARFYGLEYPQSKIEKLWNLLLDNQFHDLAAGSTIDAARVDMDRRTAFISEKAPGLLEEGAAFIAAAADTKSAAPPNAAQAIVLFNTLSFKREAVITLKLETAEPFKIIDLKNNEVPYQLTEDGVVLIAELPPMGWTTLYIEPGAPAGFNPEEKEAAAAGAIQNATPAHGAFSISLDEQNNIVSLTAGPEKKELVSPGAPSNLLCLQPDTGDTYDYAPDTSKNLKPAPDRRCTDTTPMFTQRRIVSGPIMTRVITTGKPGADSSIQRETRIYNNLNRVDFINTIDWHETNTDLHATFHFAAPGGRTDSVPLGFIQRSENGRFPIQNWIDQGSGETGVTILVRGLSDVYRRDDTMYLGLLRSVSRIHGTPMPAAKSWGKYRLQYALIPRTEELFHSSGPFQAGQNFNDDIPAAYTDMHTGSLQPEQTFLETPEGIAAAALFTDGDAIALRLMETKGTEQTAAIALNMPGITGVQAVNLVLEKPEPAEYKQSVLVAIFQPQKTKTFIIK